MTAEAVLRALAEPTRLEILRLVKDEPLSVNEITAHFDMTQQAVSQHLKVLREAGLVAVQKDAQRRLYLVDPDGIESLDAFLAELWPARLEQLRRSVEGRKRG